MGTPEFAVPSLQALLATQNVVGVITQPDRPSGRGRQLKPSPVKVAAQAAGIPVYQPRSLRHEEAAAPLRAWQPDVIVVAAFGQILRQHVLQLPRFGCINVHASLLPRWRGAAPIQHALLAGDAQTGITLMHMDVGLDTGAMYVQEAIPVAPQDTAASLHDRLAELGGAMLRTYLDEIVHGRIPPTPQDDAQATYAPMIRKEDGQIDWTKTAVSIDRLIRAMTPWPGAFTTWRGQPLKILAARFDDGFPPDTFPGSRPGTVIGQQPLVVLTGAGVLALQKVQLAGKNPVNIADFLRGHPDFIGSTLGE